MSSLDLASITYKKYSENMRKDGQNRKEKWPPIKEPIELYEVDSENKYFDKIKGF